MFAELYFGTSFVQFYFFSVTWNVRQTGPASSLCTPGTIQNPGYDL